MTGTVTVGKLLGGRYRIVKLIGEGGFGAVYKANDERFQATRVVAIKEMSDMNLSVSEGEKALKDFRREANLLVQLNHPNLPQVSDFFEEGLKAYLVMEFIEGKTLEQVLDDAGGPLVEALVMGWAPQLCSVLGYLHTRQPPIIFRDMKPANIMVTLPLVASIHMFSSLHVNSISISHKEPRKSSLWLWSRTPMSAFNRLTRCGKPFFKNRMQRSPSLLLLIHKG